MPEGDSLYQTAATLRRALVGAEVQAVEGSHAIVRREGRRLRGATVAAVESRGKHLLVHFDNGWSLRTHLGMTGRWRVYGPDQPWTLSEGKARAVIRTPTAVAVCFAAPRVDIGPRGRTEERIAHLGPDLSSPAFDEAEAVRRACASDRATAADLLLDQSVMAGVGNVFKNEILFLERLHPTTGTRDLSPEAVAGLVRRARRLLMANRRPGRRATTGARGPGRELWVHGRGGQPCRRCHAVVEQALVGDPARVTYWCPRCQPPPEPA